MDTKKKNKELANRSIDLGTMAYGKIPPQAKELEEAVLGAIMIEKGAMDRAVEFLKPETFYVESHQRVFSAMRDLFKKSQPIDIHTVCEELKSKDELEVVGGPYYVTRLTNSVVSSAHIEHHAKIILDKFTKRELIRIGSELIAGGYEDMTDVVDILDDHDRQITAITNERNNNQSIPIGASMVKMVQRIEELRHSSGHITGITSGYSVIDRITYGWQNTDLIILAARPAVGKTAFALNLARHAVINPKPVPTAFFSLEMSTGQLVQRIAAAQSDIWLEKIARGQMDDDDMRRLYSRAIQRLANAPLYIDDTPALNIFELRAKCRRLKNKHGIGLIVIDYLQLMSGIKDGKNSNREQEVSNISRSLKALAKELEVPIIALSQLNRDVDDKKGDKTPQLKHLRESGAIEQDADMVMFLYRPEYYEQGIDENGESARGLTLLSIAKHRNGDLAQGERSIKLKAILNIQKFEEWTEQIEAYKSDLGPGKWRPIESSEKDELPFT